MFRSAVKSALARVVVSRWELSSRFCFIRTDMDAVDWFPLKSVATEPGVLLPIWEGSIKVSRYSTEGWRMFRNDC